MTPPTEQDLGFGRVVAQQVRGRFLDRDGSWRARKYGLGAQRGQRLYLSALNAPWPAFLGWLGGALLLMNGIFALAYLALGSQALRTVDNLNLDDPFLRALSFSTAIFTTTGSESIHAVGPTAHWLVVLESLIGPLTFIITGGLTIARLIRPRMQLRFSDSAVVAPYQDGRGVMFRIVNVQPSELSDVQARVNVALFEEVDGRRVRNFHRVALDRDSVESFALHWTVVHPITADSPLRGVTPDSLRESEAELIVMVNAHEETFSTRVIARTSYFWDEFRWDVKFASVFASGPEGVVAIDVDRLDRVERLPEGTTTAPAATENVAAR